MQKTYHLGQKLWLQDFNFALKPFVESAKTTLKFNIINPDDFSLVEMIASKIDTGKLTIDGKEYQAQKINLTLPGFKSMFWSAEMWYDLQEKNMLMFKANEGPGTPLTTIIFVDKH